MLWVNLLGSGAGVVNRCALGKENRCLAGELFVGWSLIYTHVDVITDIKNF